MKKVRLFETFINESTKSEINTKIRELKDKIKDSEDKMKELKDKVKNEEDPKKEEILNLQSDEHSYKKELALLKIKILKLKRDLL